MVAEGVSTHDLEVAAEKMIAGRGRAAGVQGLLRSRRRVRNFPFVLCTSVNDEIVHGMPSAQRKSEDAAISCRSTPACS